MDLEFFDFYQKTLSGQDEQKANDKRSIATVNRYAGEMMGKMSVVPLPAISNLSRFLLPATPRARLEVEVRMHDIGAHSLGCDRRCNH